MATGAGRPSPAGAQRALLAAFCAQVVVTQLLWLTFSPIGEDSARALGVGSGAVGDLTAVNPLLFVLLALPAGRWLDRALVPTLLLGVATTAGGAVVRAVDPGSFTVVLVGQLVLSVGQPLLLGATTAVAARHARADARSATIAAVSAAQFVGILVAALLAAPLLSVVGFAGVLRVQAVVAVAVGLVVAALVLGVRPREVGVGAVGDRGVRLPWRDPFLLALAVVLFVGVGVFNAVATWLDAILTRIGDPGPAGALIALTTATGIVGSAFLPAWVARRDRRRGYLLLAGGLTVVGFALAAVRPGVAVLTVVLALVGLVLLPGLPVALDWAEARLGPDLAARTTSLLLMAGNLGGVVLVLVVQVVVDRPSAALLVVAALAVPAVLAAVTLPASQDGSSRLGGSGGRGQRQDRTMERRIPAKARSRQGQ